MPTRNQDILKRVYISAPCDADWDTMTGDDRRRFCGSCKMNVYNISAMSTEEAVKLISSSEDRVCLRLYRRKDGTIITDNCPVGLRRLRIRVRALVAAVVGTLLYVGAINSAQAQGLVGTPSLTPLQGQCNALPEPIRPSGSTIATNVATAMSLLWLGLAVFRRFSIVATATGLILFFVVMGTVAGLLR